MSDTAASKKEKNSIFKNVKLEFKKIVWPDKNSAFRQAVLIIVTTIILGVLIKLLDTGIQALISLIA